MILAAGLLLLGLFIFSLPDEIAFSFQTLPTLLRP
jgi:hypothetical protein